MHYKNFCNAKNGTNPVKLVLFALKLFNNFKVNKMETTHSAPANIVLTSYPLSDLRDVIKQTLNESLSGIIDRINTHPQPQTQTPEQDKLIRIEDVIKLLGVSKMTLHHWRKQGKLTYYKIGRLVYFKEREVLEAMNRVNLRERE